MSDVNVDRVIILNVAHENYKFRMHIRKDAALKILMKAFCKRTGLEVKNIRFLDPYSRRIQPRDTVEKLGLQNEDFIDTFPIQDGGGVHFNNNNK